jgi:hypothetical protein
MEHAEDFIVGHLPEGEHASATELIQELKKKPRVRALGVLTNNGNDDERHVYAHFGSTSRNYLTALKTRNSLRATMRRRGAQIVEMPTPEMPTIQRPPVVRGRQLKLHRPDVAVPIPGGDGGGGGAA